MKVFEVRNVHAALPELLAAILRDGVKRNSRNGEVLMFPTPITVVYEKPMERVVFWPERDANPFFHCLEAVWMIAGRNDVKFPATFAKQIAQYSDDGLILAGAYGKRWRTWFGKDQLEYVTRKLRENPENRRQVIAMWDEFYDSRETSKDLPCNLVATPQINVDGALDLTVFQRSGDILWGILGANAVHFSMLQEYLAGNIGVPVGTYYQVCTNAHVYVNEMLEKCKPIADREADPLRRYDPNPYNFMVPFQMFGPGETKEQFDRDTKVFFHNWDAEFETRFRLEPRPGQYETYFFSSVVDPMYHAHKIYKTHPALLKFTDTFRKLEEVRAADWRAAAWEWVARRQAKFNSQENTSEEKGN